MKIKFLILTICAFLNNVSSRQYEYEISRAKKNWQAVQRAVHYKDHFLLLSPMLQRVQGYVSTFAPLISGKNWSLSFTIELIGESKSTKDGFVFMTTSQKMNMYTLSEKNYPKKRFYIFVNGGEKDNQLWFGYQRSGKRISKQNMQTCELPARFSQDKIYIYLQASIGQIHVSYHMGQDNTGYKECGIVYFPDNELFNFYPVMYAKSIKGSKFGVEVAQMTLETELPNPAISLFENQQNENAPKLFREISFVKNNQHQVKVSGTDISIDGKLDIYKIYQLQNKIYRIVDYSNEKLGQCLSQTQSFYDFAQLQKKNYIKLGNNVVQTINTWVNKSHDQYEEMDKDIKSLKESLKSYEIGKILNKTQKVMELLSSKIFAKDSVLVDYKKFAKTIQNNIKKLGKKDKKKQRNQNRIIKFISAQVEINVNTLQNSLNLSLLVMGLIILIVLIIVYVKLGTSKREIL